MDMHSKNELTAAVAPRYFKATKQEKRLMLDEYCANTGLDRKYTSRKMKKDFLDPPEERRTRKRNRPSTYGVVLTPLVALWQIADCPCGWRLKEQLPVLIQKATSFDELPLSEQQTVLLQSISPATIDRMLKGQWRLKRKKTNSQTKKGNPYSLIPFAVDLEKVCKTNLYLWQLRLQFGRPPPPRACPITRSSSNGRDSSKIIKPVHAAVIPEAR